MIWKSYKFFESVALPSLRIKKMYTSMVGEYVKQVEIVHAA